MVDLPRRKEFLRFENQAKLFPKHQNVIYQIVRSSETVTKQAANKISIV